MRLVGGGGRYHFFFDPPPPYEALAYGSFLFFGIPGVFWVSGDSWGIIWIWKRNKNKPKNKIEKGRRGKLNFSTNIWLYAYNYIYIYILPLYPQKSFPGILGAIVVKKNRKEKNDFAITSLESKNKKVIKPVFWPNGFAKCSKGLYPNLMLQKHCISTNVAKWGPHWGLPAIRTNVRFIALQGNCIFKAHQMGQNTMALTRVCAYLDFSDIDISGGARGGTYRSDAFTLIILRLHRPMAHLSEPRFRQSVGVPSHGRNCDVNTDTTNFAIWFEIVYYSLSLFQSLCNDFQLNTWINSTGYTAKYRAAEVLWSRFGPTIVAHLSRL